MKIHYRLQKLSLLFLVLATTITAKAQESNSSISIGLTTDQFFGFAPSVTAQYNLNEKVGVSAYGIFWSAGTGGGWGNWTEFGAGLNLNLSEGVTFNPNLGFTFGNLLSKGATGPGIIGDGIVPNFFFNVDKSKFESEVYFGYYAPLRNEAPADGTTLAYLHYWANAGYKVSESFSFGAHFEHLRNTGGSNVSTGSDVYQWFGPYIQLNVPKFGSFVRLSAGGDFVEGNDSFYKLSTGFTF